MSLRFSIITCTWNSMPWLDDCLASLLAQDHADLQLVFVDGGSTDGTLERLRALPRPCTLLEGVTGGISAAMNCGLQAADGDIVGQLHADDYYLAPDVLSRVAHAFEASGGAWLFGRIRHDLAGRLVDEGYEAPAFTRARLLRRNFIPHPATFGRRWLFQRWQGFDTGLRYAMDYDLWLKFAREHLPVQLGCPLAAFRVHAGSASSRQPLAALAEDFQVRLRHAGPNPAARALHAARYLVRRERMRRAPLPLAGAAA